MAASDGTDFRASDAIVPCLNIDAVTVNQHSFDPRSIALMCIELPFLILLMDHIVPTLALVRQYEAILHCTI